MKMQKQEFDGGITLYQGDCLEIMPQLAQTADMVLCDPPYGATDNPWDAETDGSRFPVSVWECGIDAERQHPTQKPVDLLQRLIMSYTRESETVLDFTMGSGSTGVACVKTKRGFIGIEREQKYFDIACERIETALAQGVLF